MVAFVARCSQQNDGQCLYFRMSLYIDESIYISQIDVAIK